ncbi:MAG: hypothetical protein MJ252_27500, partial [archaeon]|nr:hypothetical protein [archaeon]
MSSDLTQTELDKLKVVADFLFFDEYQDKASYPQFEKTFGMFFKEGEIYLDSVFKELCGPKKKYLTFPRLIKAYLDYKNKQRKMDDNTVKFFDLLFGEMLKSEEDIILDEKRENYKAYTSAPQKKRRFISKATLVTDEDRTIKGMKLEYDDNMDVNLFDEKEDVFFENELELGPIQQRGSFFQTLLSKLNNTTEFIIRDSITHIFGTATDKVELLGFKTRAGKIYFAGKPNGKGFIFGSPMKQFHYVKFKVDEKSRGMYDLQPYFMSTKRTNTALNLNLEDINRDLWEKEPLINEEEQLQNVEGETLLDRYVLGAPIVSDDSGAGEEVKEANTSNGMEGLLAKVQKLYISKDQDVEEETNEANQLSSNDILNGGKLKAGRKGKGKGKPKGKSSGNKKTRKKIKAKTDEKLENVVYPNYDEDEENLKEFNEEEENAGEEESEEEGNGKKLRAGAQRKNPEVKESKDIPEYVLVDIKDLNKDEIEEVADEDDFEIDTEELKDLSIEQLTARINRIDYLINASKDEEEKRHLDIAKEAYVAKKNQLLKEEEEQATKEMIEKQNIAEDQIKKEEEEKRQKAIDEKNDYLSQILEETERKRVTDEKETLEEEDIEEEEEEG